MKKKKICCKLRVCCAFFLRRYKSSSRSIDLDCDKMDNPSMKSSDENSEASRRRLDDERRSDKRDLRNDRKPSRKNSRVESARRKKSDNAWVGSHRTVPTVQKPSKIEPIKRKFENNRENRRKLQTML